MAPPLSSLKTRCGITTGLCIGNDDGEFVRKVWRLDFALEGGANLLGVYSEDGVAVVGVGRQLQVLRLNEEVRPSPLAVQKVNPDGSLGEPTETLTLSSHFWYWRGDQRLDWSPERHSFTLANGLYGVTQFSIAP
jgi:hypothetical protein